MTSPRALGLEFLIESIRFAVRSLSTSLSAKLRTAIKGLGATALDASGHVRVGGSP